MISKSLLTFGDEVHLTTHQHLVCTVIGYFIMIQCLLVVGGSVTILSCLWSPKNVTADYDKLVRVMYLYDPNSCGHYKIKTTSIISAELANDTSSLNVHAIPWRPPVVTVATRLATKTTRYLQLSVFLHLVWFLICVCLLLNKYFDSLTLNKFVLLVFFYFTAFMIIFDISMGIIYIAHIQQSLTKGMVLRYSGWGVEIKLNNYEDFAGWLPIGASICWMKGILILAMNIYICTRVQLIRYKIKRREVRIRLMVQGNLPIPEQEFLSDMSSDVLYYRRGEDRPSN